MKKVTKKSTAFKVWFESRYGAGNHPAATTAKYLTRKGWLGGIKSVEDIFDNPCLDMNNSDIKFIREEIAKLKR